MQPITSHKRRVIARSCITYKLMFITQRLHSDSKEAEMLVTFWHDELRSNRAYSGRVPNFEILKFCKNRDGALSTCSSRFFTARRNARIASAVL